MIERMTETPTPAEPATGPVDTAPPPPGPPAAVAPPQPQPHKQRRSLLTSVAAWVGIVAGSVFVVAVIFFSGFILGAHSGGDHGHDRREAMMFKHRGEPSFPMGPMGPMGPTGQIERGPFVFRGPNFSPGPPPTQVPEPAAPAPSRP